MDEFFQKLRKIQKNERSNSGLARVGDDFYHRVHRYLEELMDTVGNDPFTMEYDLLKDTQRIATEICERREHKIADSAVMNIQRSYHLFKGKPQFDLQDTTPLNLTPEEEKLYFSLVDILKGHRGRIIPSLDEIDSEPGEIKPPINSTIKKPINPEEKATPETDSNASLLPGNIAQLHNQIKEKQDIVATSKGDTSEFPKKFDFKTMVIFEELPSILGVDQKVYGPFYPQDVIILPEPNAKILLKSRKGRFIRS